MTRILLVNPVDKTQISSRLGVKAPPLGLIYLASSLEKNAFSVKIVDANLRNMESTEVAGAVKSEKPDIVGLYAPTATIKTAIQCVNEIKRAVPDCFTIIGGPHASSLPVETLRMSSALDSVCIGEGERTIVEIAELFSRRDSADWLASVDGIAYRKRSLGDDGIRMTQPRAFIEDLDSLPFPARHLVPFSEYKVLSKNSSIGNMITSRGCAFSCSYCSSSHLMGGMFRARTPSNVVDEIEELKLRYGVQTIEFIDDNFVLNKKRAMEIAQEIKSRGLDIDFLASSRVDTINRELLGALKKAGLSTIYYGVESGSQRVLNLMHKGIELQKAEDAIKAAKEKDVKTLASFIIGYPGESVEEMRRTIDFAVALDPDYAQFSVLTPYPGTPIYEELKKSDLIATQDWDRYTALEPVIRYEKLGLSAKAVSRMLRNAYIRFYLRPGYLLHRADMIRTIFHTIMSGYILPALQRKSAGGWYRSFIHPRRSDELASCR